MALAQSTLVQRVRRVLQDTPAQQTATVATSNGLTITVVDSTQFDVGTLLEWQDNGEQVIVKTITNATTIDVWERGANGTTAAIHSAVKVYIEPVFKYQEILDELDRTIVGLWPWCWKKSSTTVTPNTTSDWFDIASSSGVFIDLISVVQLYGSSSQSIARFGDKDSGLPVMTAKNLPTALVTSANGIRFPNGFAHASNTVYVDYRALISTAVSGGNYTDLSDGTIAEAVVFGTAWHLVGYKETPLVTDIDVSQGETPLGPQVRLLNAEWLERQYKKSLSYANDQLQRTIPPMPTWSP